MQAIDRLSSALGRKDEVPNQELAKAITTAKDTAAVTALIENLHNKNKSIQSDCIKVIYEIGAIAPALIAKYDKELLELLENKNNRLQWGTMTALSTIVREKPESIFRHLPKLVAVAEKGSVITRDSLVAILLSLAAVPQYAADAFDLFCEQLMKCPLNQLPMYAENALPVINQANKETFTRILVSRLGDLEKESKIKRLEKVMRKASKK